MRIAVILAAVAVSMLLLPRRHGRELGKRLANPTPDVGLAGVNGGDEQGAAALAK